MRTKLSVVFLLIQGLWLFVTQSPAQSEAIFKKFAGTYFTGHEFGGGSIKLEADGTFSDGGGSDDGTTISSSGTYSLSNNVLIFSVMKKVGSRGGGKEFNLLDPKDINAWDLGRDSGEIEKEFKLLPVQWSDRIYLIYESEQKDFVNAINLGIEPRALLRSDSRCSPWYGSFYLRRGDQKKKVVGAPSLPKEWRAFLLRKPLVVSVASVEEIKKESDYLTEITFIVDKGSNDGLKAGMRLLTQNEIPSQWGGAEVISVDASKAKVKTTVYSTEKIKVSDKLYTRYMPKEPQMCRYLEMQESLSERQ